MQLIFLTLKLEAAVFPKMDNSPTLLLFISYM
jgi:hypothetical protein